MRSVDHSRQTESRWFEISAGLACWIGIIGLIIVIYLSNTTYAAPSTQNPQTPPKKDAPKKDTQKHDIRKPATDSAGHKGGFMPGAPVNPFGGNLQEPRGSAAHNSFEDDDDDDDLDDMPPPNPAGSANRMPPSRAHSPGAPGTPGTPGTPPSYSVGGTAHTGPSPTITDQGISVGGSTANNLISKNKAPAVPVDSETAEGSKAIITDFNFPDADILDIAKTLGKLTGKNFILDKDVKGKITIISNSPITVSDAWKAFLTALDINGFALIPSGKYIRIARQRDARDKQLKTYTGDFSPDTDALITRVFPLKYISAEEVARTFRSFVPANSRIIAYDQTNTVIVTDTGSNIGKLAKMLEILDVEGYDAGIEVVPVKYASAVELSKLIDALIPGTASAAPGGGAPGMPRFGGGGGGKFSARRTKEGGIINTIIADERTNTLIVHANTKGADQVRELVAKLDQKIPSSTGGGKVHVVYLQFGDAEQIATTLNAFSSQTTTRAPGGPSAAGAGTGINPNESTLFQGSIKISPDKATNALVITASPADFVTVKRVIDRLDIPRDQVYVEVVIMELTIGKNFNFSTNVISPVTKNMFLGSVTNSSDITSLFTQGPQNGIILPLSSGQPTDVTIGNQTITISSVTGLIKALQGNSNSNILATPQIIALDNSEATFETAEKIPVLTSTSVQGAGVSQSVTKEPVSLSIKIKPQINKVTSHVKMEVEAKLGNISLGNVPKGVADLAFATVDRTAKTTVVIADSDTIILGGLTRDDTSETVNKVPILGDIPILGWLFKSKVSQSSKKNLMILMTPHIVRQYDKIRALLDKKLKERDDFIERAGGGEDPARYQRDEIIRSLPDINDLTKRVPVTTYTIDEEKAAEGKEGPGAKAVEPKQAPGQTSGQVPGTSGATGLPYTGAGIPQPLEQGPPQTFTAPIPEQPVINPAPPVAPPEN